jgi:hypothetical protein
MARLEIQHLEQRFLLRVEHEQSGLPLPPRHELLPAAQPPPVGVAAQASVVPSAFFPSMQLPGAPAAVPSFPWLQQSPTPPAAAAAATNFSTLGSLVSGLDGLNAFPGANLPAAFQNTASLPIVTAAGQMLLQNAVAERYVVASSALLTLGSTIMQVRIADIPPFIISLLSLPVFLVECSSPRTLRSSRFSTI